MKINFNLILSIVLLILTTLLLGCTQTNEEDPQLIEKNQFEDPSELEDKTQVKDNENAKDESTDEDVQEIDQSNWREIKFIDVDTKSTHKISDFKGQKVLLESFAVWCPICTKQQRELKKLQLLGDESIHITLDTDPNEEVSQVIEHKNRNGFDWTYAISPKELTESLIDEFGVNVVNAPQAPIVLVCEDQTARLLPRGVKSPDDLKNEMEKGC